MSNGLRNFIEGYLSKKFRAELKCCLMWMYIVCFYCAYRWICGVTGAGTIHLLEMLFAAYIVQWVQVLIHSDFDEIDRLTLQEYLFIVVSSAAFSGLGLLLGWFDGKISVTAGFLVYMICAYICTFMVYKIKRVIDAKILNSDLKRFQERNRE